MKWIEDYVPPPKEGWYEEMRNDPATMAVFRALRNLLGYIALCALAVGAGSLTWLMFWLFQA